MFFHEKTCHTIMILGAFGTFADPPQLRRTPRPGHRRWNRSAKKTRCSRCSRSRGVTTGFRSISLLNMCMYIYIYTYHMYIYIYNIYIYISRERERERDPLRRWPCPKRLPRSPGYCTRRFPPGRPEQIAGPALQEATSSRITRSTAFRGKATTSSAPPHLLSSPCSAIITAIIVILIHRCNKPSNLEKTAS